MVGLVVDNQVTTKPNHHDLELEVHPMMPSSVELADDGVRFRYVSPGASTSPYIHDCCDTGNKRNKENKGEMCAPRFAPHQGIYVLGGGEPPASRTQTARSATRNIIDLEPIFGTKLRDPL